MAATADKLYQGNPCLHILPVFGDLGLDEITAPPVRVWRSERLDSTGAETTIAKCYRLLTAIMETILVTQPTIWFSWSASWP
ncbi:integrase [Streptomyces sp. L-9-10]|nr:integrase [Streptomyces sp. L-9-10]